MNELISFLKNQDVEYETGKLLSKLTTVGIGGLANYFISPDSKEKFTKTIGFLFQNKIRFRVVGNMSNILPGDDRVETVLVSTLKLNTVKIDSEVVYAECGALFSLVILKAKAELLGGCEKLFGIPGTVGGMLSMNSEAYGASISDFLKSVDVYDPRDDCVITLEKNDVGFFYRDSEILRQGLAVLSASFTFSKFLKCEIVSNLRRIKNRRAETQPIEKRTLGSVYKRSDMIPASYMIDRCGLKGTRVGNIIVSEKHAGFFVNEGGGTAEDFLKLSEIVKEKVKEKFGVILEEEFEYLV